MLPSERSHWHQVTATLPQRNVLKPWQAFAGKVLQKWKNAMQIRLKRTSKVKIFSVILYNISKLHTGRSRQQNSPTCRWKIPGMLGKVSML